MKPPPEESRRPGDDEPSAKPTRLGEARRVIEEYVADLREIIKKLRRKGRSFIFGTKVYITQGRRHVTLHSMATINNVTAAQCRQLAKSHKAQSRVVGISRKRVVLLSNISRSFNGLASQLEMLAADEAENPTQE